MTTTLYLSLVSNLGDKRRNLLDAIGLISQRVGTVARMSSFVETKPWGFESDNTFLNACIAVDTPLSPQCALKTTQQIERQLGRTRKSDGTYHDRTIDIDLLLYGGATVEETNLKIPHPLMGQRPFVVEPLNEIKPK